MQNPPCGCRPERFDRILSELGEVRGELRSIATALTAHAERVDQHEEEIEHLKLDAAAKQGSNQVRDKWAGRVFAVLPPVLGAAAGFALKCLLH